MTTFLIVIIILALMFDYINGFHDAANSIATVVSTKVLTPFQAVLWAALFNFVAFFIFKDHGVADTVKKTVYENYITLEVVFSGLVAAIIWNLLTWWSGIPSSSSHTLIGGFAGAAIAHTGGFHAIDSAVIIKTASFIILAPLIGMIMAFIFSIWFLNSFRKGWMPKVVSILVIIGLVLFLASTLKTGPGQLSGMVFKSKGDSLMVKDIPNNSQAQKMGFKKLDIILSIDNQPVHSLKELDKVWNTKQPGDQLSFSISRKDTVRQITPEYRVAHNPRLANIILFGSNFKWLLLGFVLFIMAVFTFYLNSLNAHRSHHWFKRLQLVSSAAFSIGHGGNDAQKVMGIITAALIAGGQIPDMAHMPVWVPLACYTAISLGTMSGGWKIVKTMGTRITKVTPFEGVAAETAGAVTLFVTEALKIPVSTTHTITGAIMGVGATKRLSAVRWGVTFNLIWAWILTIPISGLLAAGVYFIVQLFR
ncbi:MAG TPA: inorganic phosphate transporter [Chitinophagaceae bacterium]|nr:inorganic phosphate transporter [Chitinophagaceae bacterium]